jgi:hypothetical protein
MKKAAVSLFTGLIILVFSLFILNIQAAGQEVSKESPALPENINKIVSFSCVPCHTSKGGLMSREKLNFTEWTKYSVKKQKEKAEKIYSELKKSAMPPKNARENRPEIIPTKEQVNIIQKWAESLKEDSK